MFTICDSITDIEFNYNIGFSTPLEWLNDMFELYGEKGDFDDFDSALSYAHELGYDFLKFCEFHNDVQ